MAEKKIPYSYKPEDLSVEQWQKSLRKQFAKEQKFKIKNIGTHPVYSDFEVYNPESKKTYKVSIRDNKKSYNYCSCPDFSINTLGTCKHIEYVLYYFSKYKKYTGYLTKPYHPEYSSLSIYYGAKRTMRLKRAENRKNLTDGIDLFDEEGFLKHKSIDRLEAFIETALLKDPSFVVYPDVYAYLERHKNELKRQKITSKLFEQGAESPIFNGLIRANLYPYQKTGVQKIIETGRILLADEMGLGKTIQAIASVEIFAKYFGVFKVLIICPTSLKYQWKREIEKFSDREVQVVEGLIHKRKDLYMSPSFYKIISYGVCRNDLEFINRYNADLIIIDEAQRIKNWKTKIAQSVKKIVSEYAIVLTGTPLENRIDELHSIVEYVDRYKLGPLFRFLSKHEVLDSKGKLIGYKDLRKINTTLQDILLRRTKKEIIDQLPGRIDKNFFVEMTKEQENDHAYYYELVCKFVNKWAKTGKLLEEERQLLLTNLNCMRMVCDSTYILNQHTNHNKKIGELNELLSELLEHEENKIVIFSQWKRMFELVIKELDNHNISFVYLNGDIPAKEREKIIQDFKKNRDIRIFLSTDAGGVGVNLQSANILINLDLPWNPAVLEQRIGRIFRLGQKKHISVFNYISRNSIEHRILHLLEFKKTVFTGVLGENGENEVMMEGFMESVKAMTEVNIETRYEFGETAGKQNQDISSKSTCEDFDHKSADKISQEESVENKTNPVKKNSEVKNDAAQEKSFWRKIKKRITKYFRSLTGK